MLLERLEPVSPVVPARQHIGWTYVDMPESSTCAGGESCWYQFPKLDLVHSTGTSSSKFLFFCLLSQILQENDYNSTIHYPNTI
jgi:hypothetical protein